MRTLHLTRVQQYGAERLYVTDDADARALTTLTSRKTLEMVDVTALEALGFIVTIVDGRRPR